MMVVQELIHLVLDIPFIKNCFFGRFGIDQVLYVGFGFAIDDTIVVGTNISQPIWNIWQRFVFDMLLEVLFGVFVVYSVNVFEFFGCKFATEKTPTVLAVFGGEDI